MYILPDIIIRFIITLVDDELDVFSLWMTCKRFRSIIRKTTRSNPLGRIASLSNFFTTQSSSTSSTIWTSIINEVTYLNNTKKDHSKPEDVTTTRDRVAALSPGSLPHTITRLKFGDLFSQMIEVGSLPPSITSLTFGITFNGVIMPGSLPETLKELHMGQHFNNRIKPGMFPSSVTSLTFGGMFNNAIEPGALPVSLSTLTFGYQFNQPITPGNILPDNLKKLELGSHFNQPITPLPSSLVELTLGQNFAQSYTSVRLPDSLTTLNVYYTYQCQYVSCQSSGEIQTVNAVLVLPSFFFSRETPLLSSVKLLKLSISPHCKSVSNLSKLHAFIKQLLYYFPAVQTFHLSIANKQSKPMPVFKFRPFRSSTSTGTGPEILLILAMNHLSLYDMNDPNGYTKFRDKTYLQVFKD
ncbi:hypothetical protein SAMD00019534_082450, partial [Acytostelium subglobosum LB1]|uniref:hypothetical protein n=1 Tax=Acytostelium subglobosum LB1 TaxID=1410327 RepID=UPI000645018E